MQPHHISQQQFLRVIVITIVILNTKISITICNIIYACT